MSKFHGKNIRLYIDGYDLSGYTNSLDVEQTADPVDVSAFASASKEYVVGLYDSKVSHSGFFDDTVDIGAHSVLANRIGSSVNFMALVGPNAGGHGYAGSAELENAYSIAASIGGAVTHKTSLSNQGTQGVDPTITIFPRGTINVGTTQAVTMPTAVASQAGGRAYIQNFGSYGLSVPGSADGLGTVWLIGAADAAFSSGTAVIAAFGSQGTAPSASGLAFSGTAAFMKLLAGGGLGRPQVAVAVDLN